MIEIYLRPNCLLCKQIKKLLKTLKIPFVEIDGGSNVISNSTTPTPMAKIGGLLFDSYGSVVAHVLKLTNGDKMASTSVNRNDLVAKLNRGVVTVTFKKANGTTRVLKGTLSSSLVETSERKNLQTNGGLNPDVINCWDTEAKGWRTFRLNSVISVS